MKIINDIEKKRLAMYHLEVCFEPVDHTGKPMPFEFMDAHITAAHYLIQSMFDGPRPYNYDEVMARAAELDAISETNDALHRAASK